MVNAKADINYDNGQIGLYQSLLENDSTVDRTLKFASGLLGVSIDDVHKMYADQAKLVANQNG